MTFEQPQRLPRVSPEVVGSVGQDTRQAREPGKISNFTKEAYNRFITEQPDMSRMVLSYADRMAVEPEETIRIAAIALLMYEMLAVQAEVDAMNEEFGLIANESEDNK